MTQGQRIRLARHHKGHTQKDLAELIGMHYSTIIRWEKDQTEMKLEDCFKLSDPLGVGVQWLMEGYDPKQHHGGEPPTWIPEEWKAWQEFETSRDIVMERQLDEAKYIIEEHGMKISKSAEVEPTPAKALFLKLMGHRIADLTDDQVAELERQIDHLIRDGKIKVKPQS